MRSAFATAAGRFGAIDELWLFSAHPAHETFYVRMTAQNLWCRVLGSEVALAEGSVQHSVADDVNISRLIAALGFGYPVVAINAGTVDHLAATDGAGTERAFGRAFAAHGDVFRRFRIPGTTACFSLHHRVARSRFPRPTRCVVCRRNYRHRREWRRSDVGSDWSPSE